MLCLLLAELNELDQAGFSQLGKSGRTFLVMFYTQNCNACSAAEAELEVVESELTHFSRFGKMNCDTPANQAVCLKHKAQNFPFLKLFNVRGGSKGIVVQGLKTRGNIREFVLSHHKKPFIHLKGADASALSIAEENGNALFLMTPSEKVGIPAYKIAEALHDKATVVVNSAYGEDAFYRFKGSDLSDHLVKDPSLQIIANIRGRYVVYSGNKDDDSIIRWAAELFGTE